MINTFSSFFLKATNSDLSQLKLSLDDLERRKQAHQSKHADLVKSERMSKEALKGKLCAALSRSRFTLLTSLTSTLTLTLNS